MSTKLFMRVLLDYYLTALASQALNTPAAGMFTATTVTQTLASRV